MAEDEAEEEEKAPKKGGKSGLIPMLILALLGGGGGFSVMYLGLLDSVLGGDAKEEVIPISDDLAFVPLEPIVVSLGPRAAATHLKFTAHLEVPKSHEETVQALLPRVMDTLNTYLRAVDETELEEPSAMIRLRAHMLRRIQVVLGDGLVNDLLISEFVLN